MDRTFTGLVMIFLLGFTLFISFVALNSPLTGFIRASEDSAASPISSIILAWPLTVPADGKAQTKITVVPRNTKGKSLAGKSVKITSTLGTVQEIPIPDTADQYVFYLTSDKTGIAEIEAIIDNIKIQQKVTVKFQ